MDITLKIKNATLIVRDGHTDELHLELDMPSTFPGPNYAPFIKMDIQKGFGEQWVRSNLGIPLNVIGT